MPPFFEQLYNALYPLTGPDGLSRVFLMLFPYFLMLELPLTLLVLLGVLRWFVRRHASTPQVTLYRPRVSCIITCYSEGMDVQKTLLSLCEQTYPGHIELIPVVDGATVSNLVRRYGAARPRGFPPCRVNSGRFRAVLPAGVPPGCR